MKRKVFLWVILGCWLSFPSRATDNASVIDSLESILPTLTVQEDIIDVNYSLGQQYFSETEKAVVYARAAHALAKEQGSHFNIARTGYLFGLLSENLNNRQDAFVAYHTALQSYEAQDKTYYIGRCHSGLGRMYMTARRHEEAKSHFQEATAYMTELPGERQIGFYRDLGGFYYNQEDYESSIHYYQLALELVTDDFELETYVRNDLGLAYLYNAQYDLAQFTFLNLKDQLEAKEELSYQYGMVLYNLGLLRFQQNKPNEALKNFTASLEIEVDWGLTELQRRHYLIGQSMLTIGQYEEGLNHLDEAINLGKEGATDLQFYHDSHVLAIEASESMGDITSAFAYQKAYQELLFTDDQANQDLIAAEAVLQIQLAENEILDAQLAAANAARILWITISLSLASLGLGLLLVRAIKRHRKLNSKYTQKQAAIRQLKRMAVSDEW